MTTDDGYILEMHRIPHGRNGKNEESKPAVFLAHGLTCNSGVYAFGPPEKSLGYILADEGKTVLSTNYLTIHIKSNLTKALMFGLAILGATHTQEDMSPLILAQHALTFGTLDLMTQEYMIFLLKLTTF